MSEKLVLNENFGKHSGKTLKMLISEKRIKARIKELGSQISNNYRDVGSPLIVIGILNGSFIFMSDLVRDINIDLEVDFMRIASYGNATSSSGTVRMIKDINADITNRHVLVVEDIVDTGLSMNFLKNRLEQASTKSLEFAALIMKENTKIDFDMDYVGFEIPDKYVVGYGLDLAQKLRNLKSIYYLE
ncbi:MAG: hypoxanthine phosphoribosyltransferase [Candidatus Marinimicrobia bacterium]|nr:hypoxanthine phosphoribosyltransferase [Candidatus Neomarinimicrobiota bacterium]